MSTVLANTITAVGGGGSTLKMANDATYVSEGGAVTQNTVQGLTKFWICYTGDSKNVQDSFNMASLTDEGPGDATIAFTNAMGSGNFATSSLSTEDGTIGYVTMYYARNYSSNANNIRLQGIDQSDTFDDGSKVSMMSTGDLA
jgi:hypothetical protein